MSVALPQTPQEIRDLLIADPARITDQQLLALVLAKGSTRRRTGRRQKSWTTVQLAADLYAAAGGRLADLVEQTYADTIDLAHFGIGESIGARLIASMDLARRWRRGFDDGGDRRFSDLSSHRLRKVIFHRQEQVSDADLIAVILAAPSPDQEMAQHLLDELGGLQDLVTSLALDAFEAFRKESILHLRLPKTGAEVKSSAFYRLYAAVELARRYRGGVSLRSGALEPGMFGLKSAQLVQLLDPASTLEEEFRMGMIEVLRSHPGLTQDFVKLDVLASDARTDCYLRAIELALMFEQLRNHRGWSHPSEVLEDDVPYGALLAIAQARIQRASRPAVRIERIQELLEQAEHDAMKGPIEAFVRSLLDLRVSTSSVEPAI